MEHLVYLNSDYCNINTLLYERKMKVSLDGNETSVFNAMVQPDDVLFFVENNTEMMVKAKAMVKEISINTKIGIATFFLYKTKRLKNFRLMNCAHKLIHDLPSPTIEQVIYI